MSSVAVYFFVVILSEARSLLGHEIHSMASGHISRMRLNFLTLFSDSDHVARCYYVKSCGLPQDDLVRPTAYILYCLAGLWLPGKSMFTRPKMMAPSWPKVICPIADGKDVAVDWPILGFIIPIILAT